MVWRRWGRGTAFFVIRAMSPPGCLSFTSATGGAGRKGSSGSRYCLHHDFFSFTGVVSQASFFLPSPPSPAISRFLNLYRFFAFHVFLFSFPPIGGIVEARTLILSRVLVSGGRTSQKCRVKQKNTSRACFYVQRRTHFFLLHFIFFSSHFFPGRYFLRARGSLFVSVFSVFTPVS